MHTRSDAERAIRKLALTWMDETGFEPRPGNYPSFLAFKLWLDNRHQAHYLDFRSQISPRSEAEGWFEDEIRRHWRGRAASSE